jgi:hypothetical protein
MADDIVPFGHTGKFTIGTPRPGALLLQAVLTVPPNSSIVTGHGHLTQAIDPPPGGNTAFHGVVHSLGFGPAKQVYSLQGVPVPPSPLVTYVSHLSIVLDGIWGTKGKATYIYFKALPQHGYHEVKDADVTVQWLLQE